jgi:hypothetical protein
MTDHPGCAPPGAQTVPARLVAAGIALMLLLALALAAPARADDAGVPDPLAYGPHSVDRIDYRAGTVLLTHPTTGETISAPMRGAISYPTTTTEPGKVIVFVHGRHSVCIGSPPPGEYFCEDEEDPDGTPTSSTIRSYGGYDYLARNLASHGYVVMSIEANTSNFDNNWKHPDDRFASTSCGGWCDGGAGARAQIIDASLNLLWRWNKAAGPYVEGRPQHTVGTKLVGKIDFADGIGLMGHSRGGDAVTDYIAYNRSKTGGQRRFVLDAVIALAPVNYTRFKTPYGTNYAVILPACDGDVSTLQGGRFFENAKYAVGGDGFAKVQWYVQGANHNFFNTVWTDDDSSTTTDPACARSQPTTARLTPGDQRRVGQALMNGFLRRFVGDEEAFDPLITGEVTLPESAAPLRSGKGTAQTVKTSYVGPATRRLDVLRPEPMPDTGDPFPAGDLTQLTTAATGGAMETSGFDKFTICQPQDVVFRQGPTLPVADGYEICPRGQNANGSFTSRNRSIGTQYTLEWSGPATLTAGLAPDGEPVDVSGFGALHLRTSVNRWDPKNPQGDGYTPTAATQDFTVTLVDAGGRRASTAAAGWTTSLQPSIGNQLHVVLNGIRIPLTAFGGVDLERITAVELGFGTRTPSGSIQLADVMFQEAARPVAPTPPGPDRRPPAAEPPSVPPGPVISAPVASTAASASGGACTDRTAPTVMLGRMAMSRGRIVLRGAAADSGCPGARGAAAGGVGGTFVTIYRKAGTRCRYVTKNGRLRRAASCSTPLGMLAKGRGQWSLTIAAKRLPKGTYLVRVTTFDRAGNAKRLKLRTLRVR